MRQAYLVAAIVYVLGFETPSALAQVSPFARPGRYGPYLRPPTLSPYLNLLNNGNNAAVNYYMQVLPEFRRREVERQFGSALLDLDRRTLNPTVTGDVDDLFPTLPGTGHPVGFMTFSPYYNMGGGLSRPLPQYPRQAPLGNPNSR